MKYNLSRLAVRQRQVPLEKLDVPDSDNEEEMPQKSTASSAKAAKRNIKQDAHDDDIDVDDQGQDDQLMDFELSEEEER